MSHQLRHLRGLPPEDMQPRQRTPGAALVVGRKDPQRGFPIDKDQFLITETETVEIKGAGSKFEYRPLDFRFAAFNTLPKEARRVFAGNLVFHHEAESFDYGLMKYRGPSGRPGVINPPHRGPWCRGDGETAERWDGKAYATVAVCGKGCPFYDEHEPRMTLYFQPRWSATNWGGDLAAAPRPLMKLNSRGRRARETFAGMLEDLRAAADGVGVQIDSLFGVPFHATLGERTSAAKKTRYPVITFTFDGDPLEWVHWQARKFQGLLDAPVVLALGAASDGELDAETKGEDHLSISTDKGPATKPAATMAPDVVDVDPIEEPKAEPSAGDPRTLREMISEDYVAAGIDPKEIGAALVAADLKGNGKPLPEDTDRADVRAVLDTLEMPEDRS